MNIPALSPLGERGDRKAVGEGVTPRNPELRSKIANHAITRCLDGPIIAPVQI
jgi:hypothetical protein